MKGSEIENISEQCRLLSECLDTQNNNLDTESYFKDNVKHVYAYDNAPGVCFIKDGELKYFLKKLKILFKRISKNDFVDGSKKEKIKDLLVFKNSSPVPMNWF